MKFQTFLSILSILCLVLLVRNTNAADNYQLLSNVGTGCLCLDQSTTDKNKLTLNQCNTRVGSTQYIGGDSIVDYTEGNYTMKFKVGNLLLDVKGESKSVGAEILQWKNLGQDNQLWSFVPVKGFVQIVSKHSGHCLTANLNEGYRAITMLDTCCNENLMQLWDFGNAKCGAQDTNEK